MCYRKIHTQYTGRELCRSVYNILEKLGLVRIEPINKYFVVLNGHRLGNVYTAYKYMYNAGGYKGIIFYQTITAMVYSFLYATIKNEKKLDFINCKVLLYSIFIYAIVLHPFSEFFFSTIISFNYFMLTILLLGVKSFIQKANIRNEVDINGKISSIIN